ncbi:MULTISPECIES: methionine ABC transporter substrate-binding lipoprotein MetQ [Sphingobacterium]|jgi:D-methionine transport system substrate-binding protein|uniref:methionine ABC transporter substrate-binding lipoprotein MetQ n=1 Tax=Sphingobacterium TaxID=28453 RepID=UPI0004E5FA82|nr:MULTISPECIES: methionine ABC transporter substrate-binding lipoprotein MetQ [Sphingobacterium]UPZ34914.1 methionine ABC transporter substrate-binding lipoprotein MetQ [Sphingobacterium sp. PCS056]UXD70491.1 methionine ABC transporter substrate-binding lipoprotein MetQ [Sphingobacterium faecium]WGQ14063.1 methionine ABC transporter substrate-binding lipoprotein MetQ [Sphingobacterium faecium]CDT22084.1 DL-methionine transporter subunit; periplasmic-binding component of ABC superfamily [Sphing
MRLHSKLCVVALTLVGLIACNGKKTDSKVLKVGIVAGPEQEIAETAKKVAKEKFNLDVELVSFNDYVVPNEALNQGDIDINSFQHLPYLQEQSRQRGYKLAAVANTFVFPIVAYSKKIKSISELQPGATIVIPNDPTNGGRSLLLLQKEGLIKLKDNVGLLPKKTDIIDNPKKLNIMELEAPQLPRVLDDKEVVIAIINNTFAAQAGLNPEKEGLFAEDSESPYVNLIVSREDNRNDERIKQFIEAYQSPEVEATAKRVFKGGAIKGW